MIDVDELLAPVSEDNPAGADLSYDPERQLIESAFESRGEDDEPVDWPETTNRIVAQAAKTKDVWLAIYLARAGANAGRIETVDAGCRFLAGLFEDYWETLYPTLDDYGFQGRKGPCESLTRIGEFLRPLRQTVLIEHPRLGRFTGEDIERFKSGGDSEEGYGMFRAAVAETPAEEIQAAIGRLDSIRAAIRRVDGVLTEHAEGDTGTNFAATYEVLEAIRKGLVPYSGLAEEEADAPEPSGHDGEAAAVPDLALPTGGKIETRGDVVRAIDAIMDYYRRREPGSPVPVVLNRARRWVELDFLTALEDIAPGGMADARRALTFQRDETE